MNEHTNNKESMMEKLHFDGHGINNERGERVAKVSIQQWAEDGRGLNPEFERLSNLLASSGHLLEFAQDILRYVNAGTIETPEDLEFIRVKAMEVISLTETGESK